MFWKAKVCISKEMYLNSKPIIYFCRFLGYFPFVINQTKSKMYLQWSPYYALYSFILGAFLIIASYWQIYKFFVSNPEVHMTSISLLTVFVGFSGWLLTLFCAIFIMPMRVQKFFAFVRCLNKVDSSLNTVYKNSDKYVALLTMVLIFIPGIGSFVMDYILEIGTVFSLKLFVQITGILHTMQTLVITVTYIIRYMVYGLGKRISRLNYFLELENLKYRKISRGIPGRIQTEFRLPNSAGRRNQSLLFSEDGGVTDTSIKTISPIHDDTVITKLMNTYLKLCEAATLLNQLLNETMTVAIIGCAIQLLHPTYFLILCMTEGSYPLFTEAALMNIFKDLVWEICIIDSCYVCIEQVKTTEKLVCKLLSWNTSTKYRLQVKRFALCLGLSKIEFSAFDFFKIDRLLFTDMLDTYTTVLMLLLQMHYDNDGVSQ